MKFVFYEAEMGSLSLNCPQILKSKYFLIITIRYKPYWTSFLPDLLYLHIDLHDLEDPDE